jgi:ATP-dependent Clp protease ATP-binding subunit ClpC
VFERFKEQARQVVVLAQDEARGIGDDFIGPEHLLLGLLREDGAAARVIEARGIVLERSGPADGRLVTIVPAGDAYHAGFQRRP